MLYLQKSFQDTKFRILDTHCLTASLTLSKDTTSPSATDYKAQIQHPLPKTMMDLTRMLPMTQMINSKLNSVSAQEDKVALDSHRIPPTCNILADSL